MSRRCFTFDEHEQMMNSVQMQHLLSLTPQPSYFMTNSGPASGLAPAAGAMPPMWLCWLGAGAMSSIDMIEFLPPREDEPPRPAVLPPRPPRLSWEVDAVVPLRSLCLSEVSVFFEPRPRRETPPREPGPRNGRPVS